MEPKAHHINLGSKIYDESFTISWRIKGFNKMPFLEDHPVCGPWFTLGKKRQSTWSLLMTKQVHHGVKNMGFRLVRAEDETVWDVVEFCLGLKTDDGRFISLIEKQVVGKESSNSYIFLLCPTGSGMVNVHSDVKLCGDSEVSVKEPVNVGKLLALIESSGNKGSTSIENSSYIEGSSLVNGSTVENGCSSEESSEVNGTPTVQNGCRSEGSLAVNGTTAVEDGCSSEESSGVNGTTTVQNGCRSEGSLAVNGTTAVEDGCSSEESPGGKSTDVSVRQSRILGKYAMLLRVCEQLEEVRQDILKLNGCNLVLINESTNIENSSSSNKMENVKNTQNLHISTKLPNPSVKDSESDTRHLTPEELFQQENITVVCRIQYTYMTNDPVPNEEESDHSDMIETFRDLYTSGKFSDITLKCEDVHFLCHKAILSTRSPLFRDFVDKDLALNLDKEGPAPDLVLKLNLDLTTAKAMLFYVYTDELDDEIIDTEEECWRLGKAAVHFGLPGLKKLCLAFLMERSDEDECVFAEEFETQLDQKLSLLSICSGDDKSNDDKSDDKKNDKINDHTSNDHKSNDKSNNNEVLVGEQAPVTDIGTQTSTSN